MGTQLTQILMENTENRVSLIRLEAVMENLVGKLSEKEQKELAKVYFELKELADSLNETPYTVFNNNHWKLLNMVLAGKVAELRLLAEDIAEDNKEIDLFPLMNAIDLILIY